MHIPRLGKLPTVLRYSIAALIVVAVFGIVTILPKGQQYPFLLFFPTILIVAVMLDHGCSVFATLFAAVLVAGYMFGAQENAPTHDTRDLLWVAIFVASGLAIGSVVEAMREALDGLSKVNAALVHAQADLKQQSILFNAVLEGTPDPIYVKDTSGCFVHVNTASARLLGTTVAAVQGRPDRDFLEPEYATAIEATDRAVMVSRNSEVVEERVALPGAASKVFLSTKFPWLDVTGGVLGLIGISRDITDRKAAEEALRAADDAKQLLLYDINHRIKNHLQSVAGLMDMAARRATTLDDAQLALTAAAGRLTVLGQVYTRLQLSTESSVVDTHSFVAELCAGLAASLVGSRSISIRCDAVAVPLESGRAVTLGLFINELVQNALKYAFPGDRAGTIRVRLRAEDQVLVLTVDDDGVGIDAENPPAGTGTGQRLLRAMAGQLGGTIEMGSGPGAHFTLRFAQTGD